MMTTYFFYMHMNIQNMIKNMIDNIIFNIMAFIIHMYFYKDYDFYTGIKFVSVPKCIYDNYEFFINEIGEDELKQLISELTSDQYDFSIFTKSLKPLDPYYVTGLADAEGSFQITISVHPSGNTKIDFEFKISQHSESAGVLHDLQLFFGVGNVVWDSRKTGTMKFTVKGLDDIINHVLPHFNTYPLVTSKKLNFNDFQEAVLLKKNSTNNNDITQNITIIKSRMNKTRSFEEKYASLSIIVLNPQWVLGFVDGDGCYYVEVGTQKARGKVYPRISMSLEIAQNAHEAAILQSIVKFFGGGGVYPLCDWTNVEALQNTASKHTFKLKNIDIIIPFFIQNQLRTDKQLDFKIFCAIAQMWKNGLHKTPEGLVTMKALKGFMNSSRNTRRNRN